MNNSFVGDIVIYESSNKKTRVEVKVEKDTIWMTQFQIANLFQTDRSVISKHLNNIFFTKELDKNSNVQKMHIAQSDKPVNIYKLDAIISVGYRVNSKRATQFRIWATDLLKEYLIQGYAVNEKRILEVRGKFKELQDTIAFIKEKSKKKMLEGHVVELLDLISQYSNTFTLLEQFDRGKLTMFDGNAEVKGFTYKEAKDIVEELRKNLYMKKEANINLFGNEQEHGFESIIKVLYQTFGSNELYKTIEDKASHLLYFVIKDHPFIDGNKRIGSFLFVYFLQKNNFLNKKTGEKKINDNALTALALLIAESNPTEKDIMIQLIKHLII